MAEPLIGNVRVVDDVADAFARIVVDELAAKRTTQKRGGAPFRLGLSGGASGARCVEALVERELAWDEVSVYFADERCVPADDQASNQALVARLLGSHRGELAGFHPMDGALGADAGAAAYELVLREAGALDVLQLGFGQDGHTASLFPGSPALAASPAAFVAGNVDSTGTNPLPRITLTFTGIALASLVVIVVSGAEKADALRRVAAGEPLPAGQVRAGRVIWLVDRLASEALA